MKRSTVDLICCRSCRGELSLHHESALKQSAGEVVEEGVLTCPLCKRRYPITNGIPSFIDVAYTDLPDRHFARFYDWLSRVYAPFTKLAFLPFGGDRRARKEVLDHLELRGGRVLEVSVGTGSNLPYLFESPGAGQVCGLDISPGQLARCRSFINRHRWSVDLFLGTAEALPFKSESFDSVFHIGGINFFSQKKQAIEEMIRVARPGTKIVIADESERMARALSRIPGFSRGRDGKTPDTSLPVHLVPDAMEEVEVTGIWKAHGQYHGYCLEFRRPL